LRDALASSRTFNPTLKQSTVDRADERAAASAEYGGEFRSDVEAFVSREVIEAAIESGVHERGRIEAVRYFGFVGPSGGSADSMTLAIAHAEERHLVLDVVRERKPPFSPEAVVADYAADLKQLRHFRGEGRPLRRRVAARGLLATWHQISRRGSNAEGDLFVDLA
jgi:hypothetical protein